MIERDLSSGTDRVIIARPRSGLNLQTWSLSPDGRYAVASKRHPSSGSITLVIPISGEGPRDVEGSFIMWAPDSQSMVLRKPSAGGESELWRVPVDGGDGRKLEWKFGAGIRLVRPSPDGRRLAMMVTSTPKPGEVWALENFLSPQPVKK